MGMLISYRRSIQWVAKNDDVENWPDLSEYPISARLIAYQFEKDTDKVIKDILEEFNNA